MTARRAEPTLAELFTPKLITILREGYRLRDLRADAVAGLTVAIVALPLSMAIAIASGVSPDRGLYTAIVGGFIVSALGGSRFQIGGPAGAFIVLVAATVERHGIDGLLLATILSGAIILAVGLLRLGTFIKYIPFPVTVGFTAGIAVIILASQLKDLLGLTLAREPGPLIPKLAALGEALPSLSIPAAALSAVTIGLIAALRRWRPHWPAMLSAVASAAVATWLLDLTVETIGTRFGGIPSSLPAPHLPALTADRIAAVLPSALSFALLGSIESLLSAVVTDSMSGRRHRSNCELVAQGLANIASPPVRRHLRHGHDRPHGDQRPGRGARACLGDAARGLPAAVHAGRGPARLVHTARGAGCGARRGGLEHGGAAQFATLLRASRGDAVVLLATFLLVIFRDLTEGILVGFGIGALLFLHRMAQTIGIESRGPEEDRADKGDGRRPYDVATATDPDVVVVRISGAFFFGAAATVGAVLDRLAERPKAYVLDLSAVPILDSTAAATVEGFVRNARRRGAVVYIAGAQPTIRRALLIHGVRPPLVRFKTAVADAVADARGRAGAATSAPVPADS